ARRLQTAYVWNFLDPTFFFAFYSTFVNKVYSGERYSRMPLPSVGGVVFYPAPRFNLSPFGAEHYLDLFLQRGTVLADLYGRAGSSGLASYTGGGARVLGWKPHKAISLGGEMDVWKQPELLVEQRNVYAPPDEWGVNGGIFGTLNVFGGAGITGKLAYK